MRGPLRELVRLVWNPTPTLDRLAETYGRRMEFGAGPLRVALLGDGALLRSLLLVDPAGYRWSRVLHPIKVVIGRTGMLVSDGEPHDQRRRAVQPALARRHADDWADIVIEEVDRCVERLPVGVSVDLYEVLQRVTRRTTSRLLLGGSSDPALIDRLLETLSDALAFTHRSPVAQAPLTLPFTPRAAARRSRRQADRLLREELRHRREGDAQDSSDVLALLAGSGLSDEEVLDQIVTLLGAGEDTTAAGASWMFAALLCQPDLLDEVRAEATATGPPSLRFAEAVMRESLRLYPPGPLAARECVRPIEVDDVRLPRGSILLWSPHLVGRDPATHQDPLAFRPERYLGTRAAARTDWLPFGAGPRICVGRAAAEVQLVHILRRFATRVDMALEGPGMPEPKGVIVSRPSKGLPVRILGIGAP